MADYRAIKWVPEFLTHDDQGVQNWGVGVIDQLLFADLCDSDDVSSIIQSAKNHDNEYVRERVEFILSMLAANEERDSPLREQKCITKQSCGTPCAVTFCVKTRTKSAIPLRP